VATLSFDFLSRRSSGRLYDLPADIELGVPFAGGWSHRGIDTPHHIFRVINPSVEGVKFSCPSLDRLGCDLNFFSTHGPPSHSAPRELVNRKI
jgi:hypothetical protein